jgi:hypothetical protein
LKDRDARVEVELSEEMQGKVGFVEREAIILVF